MAGHTHSSWVFLISRDPKVKVSIRTRHIPLAPAPPAWCFIHNHKTTSACTSRFAQVVMWLEALAAQKLPDPVRDPSCRFGPQEGVWKETLRGLGSSTRHGGSADSELDPDAPSRDQLRLALADREAGLKLAAWAWRLVRAGGLWV